MKVEANMANSQYLIPRIEAVRTLAKSPATLSLRFAGGEAGRVDLSEVIRGKPALTKLRDVETFRGAKPSDHGFGVVWPGGIEIGADTLYWLYRRQNGLWDAADEYEQNVRGAYEKGRLRSVATKGELARLKAAARATAIG